MEVEIKQRLIGAAVVVGSAVLILPWVFDGPPADFVDGVAQQPTDNAPTEVRIIQLNKDAPMEATATAQSTMPGSTERAVRPGAPAPRARARPVPATKPSADGQNEHTASASKPITKSTAPEKPAQPKPKPRPKPASAKPKPKPKPAAPAQTTPWVVQFGAFGSAANANRQADQLRANGVDTYVEVFGSGSKRRHHVRAPAAATRDEAIKVAERLKEKLGVPVVVRPSD